ncbi:MAG: hypothetical protein M3A44_05525 [Gammaproteobacteria bacterium]
MNQFIAIILASALTLFSWGNLARAADNSIELKMVAEKEVETVNSSGKKELKRVEPALVTPGEEIIYTLSYSNTGKEIAKNIFITNPVPQHMAYKPNSAAGESTAIVYSLDGGKTFDKPENLKVRTSDGKERVAMAANYSHIRWIIQKPLPPGTKGDVSFRALLQ